MRQKKTFALAGLAAIALTVPAALLRADDDDRERRDDTTEHASGDSGGRDSRSGPDVRVRLRVRGRRSQELRVRLTVRNRGREDLGQVEVTLHDGDPATPLWSDVISLDRNERFRRRLRIPTADVEGTLTADWRIVGAGSDTPTGGEDPTTGPPAPTDTAAMRGRDLYVSLCAGCHGPTGRGGSATDDDIAREDWDELFEAFREGEDGMPLFPTLTAGDAKDIAAFLRDPDGVPPTTPPTEPPTIPPTEPPTTPPPAPTYAADVKPILDSNCVVCHKTGGAAAGIALDTYAKASSAAGMSLNAIRAGRMPPGGALSAADIQVIADWIATGKTR